MRIAVLSDIHANLHALQAVWEDVSRLNVDNVYCLGDLVGYGAYPNEVVAFVQENRIHTVMGNYDEAVGYDMRQSGTLSRTDDEDRLDRLTLGWTRRETSMEGKTYLQSLPISRRERHRMMSMVFVHGSPRRMDEYLYPDLPLATFQAMARLADSDVVFMGHTHLPLVRRVDGTWFVNPGSVGMPRDGNPQASYAVFSRGLRTDIEIRRVTYDVDAAIDAVTGAGLPDELATWLTAGLAPKKVSGLKGEIAE